MKPNDLRRLRRGVGVSQHWLARKIGIHRWKISHAELGIVTLSEQEVSLIRKTLLDLVRKRNAAIVDDLGDGGSERNDARARLRSA